MIQVKLDGSLDQLGSNGYGGERYGYILKLEVQRFAKKLNKN